MSRIRVKTFRLSRSELEEYLIARGEPKDIVVTGIRQPVNQEVWLVSVQSKEYEETGDYGLGATDGDKLLMRLVV